jgi:ankyrin repeat protein
MTYLHHAALYGATGVLRLALDAGCPPDVYESFFKTPLSYACEQDQAAAITELVAHGADERHDEHAAPGSTTTMPAATAAAIAACTAGSTLTGQNTPLA